MEKQTNPDFDKIIKLCINELNIKFQEYGNSWVSCDKKYWIQRISNEVKEYEMSMTAQSEKRKIF